LRTFTGVKLITKEPNKPATFWQCKEDVKHELHLAKVFGRSKYDLFILVSYASHKIDFMALLYTATFVGLC